MVFQKLLLPLLLPLLAFCAATPSECGPNEIFKSLCIPNKCQCLPQFVRNESNGKCVRINDCDKKCGEDEEFFECGTHCEPICAQPDPPCIKLCKPNVCQCSKGFVKHENVCIQEANCPK
ncbi:Protein CBG22479 [Caenorhabditis briggsae]|uniref:Protein CBG22479 n=1 Tax=Caenorhabditis briggsae TaxID=6238 RepID=A8Y2D7_CAEBR|nr:Protein CBG22479 [Caenorhabditis briggsae]CAP39058.1 Protein CBG22479 [Caenorhabditis briggsae]